MVSKKSQLSSLYIRFINTCSLINSTHPSIHLYSSNLTYIQFSGSSVMGLYFNILSGWGLLNLFSRSKWWCLRDVFTHFIIKCLTL